MNEKSLELLCLGTPEELCSLFEPCLEQAATSLFLAADFTRISLNIDDLKECDEPWLHIQKSADQSGRYHLEVHLNSLLFQKGLRQDSGVFLRNEIWESQAAPQQALAFDAKLFQPEFCLQHLHHHLLLARDLVRQELIPGRIPTSSVEAFQACWAVTVDARLENWDMPGFALSVRRRHFSRLFSQAGVLMPNHWSIFQALWEGGISGQRAVLDATERLPSL